MRTLYAGLLLLAAVLVGGCSRWSYDIGEPLAATAWSAGEASLGDVLLTLGPPQRISALPEGYVMAWEHWMIEERALGVSLGPMGADFLAIDWGSARVAGEFLLLSFDRRHRLVDSSFSRWDEQAGEGQALQLSLGVIDVVNVRDLIGPMPQHRWGATSLQRLPLPLNSASSPEMGGGGLEQRGTPRGAGQRTLEWQD